MGRYKRRPPKVIVIKYHCATGKPVWLYRGQSREAMWKMYSKARRKEQKRARHFKRRMEWRRRKIQQFLDECLAALPILGELTKEQRDAVRRLKAVINEKQERYSDFYRHCRTERDRRKRDREIRRKMRERDAQERAEREAQKAAQTEAQTAAQTEAQENHDNRDYDK